MIKSVRLVNFFSFGDCTIDLESDLNVLVGINGSGKSNFLRAFQFLQAGLDGKLKEQIARWGGYYSISNKAKNSEQNLEEGDFYITFRLDAKVLSEFGFVAQQDLNYTIKMGNNGDGAYYTYETIKLLDETMVLDTPDEGPTYYSIGKSDKEVLEKYTYNFDELALPNLVSHSGMPAVAAIIKLLRKTDIYKEFSTAENSPMRNSIRATGINKLLPTGDNMFQVLNMIGLKSTISYDAVESGLHDVNGNFQRFRMNVYGQGSIEFFLQEKGIQTPVHAAQVSDGTLCYLCLLVALYQPERGRAILFDEPERNLHPDMLFELAKQLEKASEKSQIILTTHAPGLLNQFPLRAVRVFEKDENNQTIVKKFTEEDFAGWYDEFAPGQMWRNGDLGGNRY